MESGIGVEGVGVGSEGLGGEGLGSWKVGVTGWGQGGVKTQTTVTKSYAQIWQNFRLP